MCHINYSYNGLVKGSLHGGQRAWVRQAALHVLQHLG